MVRRSLALIAVAAIAAVAITIALLLPRDEERARDAPGEAVPPLAEPEAPSLPRPGEFAREERSPLAAGKLAPPAAGLLLRGRLVFIDGSAPPAEAVVAIRRGRSPARTDAH